MSQVHSTAIIDEGATLGTNCKVWHWTHVCARAKIGANTSLGQNVYIGNVSIGSGCKIQNNVSIFDGVEIDDDVFIGPAAVFSNDLYPRAFSKTWQVIPTRLHKGVSVGANATIVCGVNLGEFCMVGAGSVVTKDVDPFTLVVGNPARPVGMVDMNGNRIH